MINPGSSFAPEELSAVEDAPQTPQPGTPGGGPAPMTAAALDWHDELQRLSALPNVLPEVQGLAAHARMYRTSRGR